LNISILKTRFSLVILFLTTFGKPTALDVKLICQQISPLTLFNTINDYLPFIPAPPSDDSNYATFAQFVTVLVEQLELDIDGIDGSNVELDSNVFSDIEVSLIYFSDYFNFRGFNFFLYFLKWNRYNKDNNEFMNLAEFTEFWKEFVRIYYFTEVDSSGDNLLDSLEVDYNLELDPPGNYGFVSSTNFFRF